MQGVLPDGEDRLPDLLGDARMTPARPQPPVIRAPRHPRPAARDVPPDQRPVADTVQPQQPRLISIQRPQFRDLRVTALRQRRPGRVVLRFRLPGTRPRRIAASEAGLGFQQMRQPQVSHFTLVR